MASLRNSRKTRPHVSGLINAIPTESQTQNLGSFVIRYPLDVLGLNIALTTQHRLGGYTSNSLLYLQSQTVINIILSCDSTVDKYQLLVGSLKINM